MSTTVVVCPIKDATTSTADLHKLNWATIDIRENSHLSSSRSCASDGDGDQHGDSWKMDLSQLEITLDKLRKQGEFNDMIVSGFGDYRPRTPTEGFVSHCLPQHFVGWQTFTTFQGRQSGTEVTKVGSLISAGTVWRV